MQTDQVAAPSIRYAVLIIDEPRLIIEYSDGSREQILGEEALIRWQKIRRGRGVMVDQQDLQAAQDEAIC